MIKKIYDRDTGNIYDVGADNKLKLVYENNESNIEYEVILENNKTYLIRVKKNDGEVIYTHNFTLYIDNNEMQNFIVSNSLYCHIDECHYWAQYNQGYVSFSSVDEDIYVNEIQIYELPFSL